MTLQQFVDFCSAKPGVTREFPFDAKTLVLKVMGKMFALTGMEDQSPKVNLKCDPLYAIVLRQKYESVMVGYHMNKKHWNTVDLAGDVPDGDLEEMIDDSYQLVVNGLTRKIKEELKNLGE